MMERRTKKVPAKLQDFVLARPSIKKVMSVRVLGHFAERPLVRVARCHPQKHWTDNGV